MLRNRIEDTTEADLQLLVSNKTIEGKLLEYKKEVSLATDSEKKEFLADVSSFANASGGDLIIGIESDSETGEPKSVLGINCQNTDEETQRIDNFLRDGLKPRVYGIQIQPVKLESDNVVIVIRVPRSWNAPHRIEFKQSHKFYTRSNNGKYPMDIDELRSAFTLSETVTGKVNEFRLSRIGKIYANESFIPLFDKGTFVLHMIPLESFRQGFRVDAHSVNQLALKLKPMYAQGWDHQSNIDGYMAFSSHVGTSTGSYAQLYRNGIIESACSNLFHFPNGELWIPSSILEQVVLQHYEVYLGILRELNITPPIIVSLSLVNIKNHQFQLPDGMFAPLRKHPHNQEVLNFEPVLVESLDSLAKVVLKPIFDSMWNAYGYKDSPAFRNL